MEEFSKIAASIYELTKEFSKYLPNEFRKGLLKELQKSSILAKGLPVKLPKKLLKGIS